MWEKLGADLTAAKKNKPITKFAPMKAVVKTAWNHVEDLVSDHPTLVEFVLRRLCLLLWK